jgi:hypothetical protein
MKVAFFRSTWVVLALLTLSTSAAFAQAGTYHFGESKKPERIKLPKMVPGRIHFLDGSSRNTSLGMVDYNQIVALEDGAVKKYTPLEVSSFVMKQDSFVVLKEFKITEGDDEQEFRIAFVQVGIVGAGFVLYHFKGTMRHDDVVHHTAPVYNGGTGSWMHGTQTPAVTEYSLSKVWFIKRDNDPRWISLPKAGGRLRDIIEPLIADDKKLVRSIEWNFFSVNEVPDILLKYAANKSAVRN